MTEEMINETETEFDAIEEIKKLRENMVSKDDYEKLKRENGKLLKTLISGGQVKDESKKTADEMRKTLYVNGDHLNNLEFVSNLLDLRDAEIASGKQDIFVANGKDYSPTQNDFAEAENVASVLRKCVDDANGDPNTFNDMIRRYMR